MCTLVICVPCSTPPVLVFWDQQYRLFGSIGEFVVTQIQAYIGQSQEVPHVAVNKNKGVHMMSSCKCVLFFFLFLKT